MSKAVIAFLYQDDKHFDDQVFEYKDISICHRKLPDYQNPHKISIMTLIKRSNKNVPMMYSIAILIN